VNVPVHPHLTSMLLIAQHWVSDASDVLGSSLADWLHPKPTAHERKFQQKPATGVSFQQDVTLDANGNTRYLALCWTENKYTTGDDKLLQHCHLFKWHDLLSRARMLHVYDLPPKITVQGKTLYIDVSCDVLGCWYLYDGLKVGI